ncbi:hypothetical protein HKX48_003712 [Thoreauomyces humboldtii]|nr:hypothetical protein HKX48_003712 [Thoreauomyces humboldtii]
MPPHPSVFSPRGPPHPQLQYPADHHHVVHRPPHRILDVTKLPESLQVAWLQKVDKDVDRRAEEWKRACADSDKIRAERRKVQFELWLANWEVDKWENMNAHLNAQLAEHEVGILQLRAAGP